jgi:hypothetical protein
MFATLKNRISRPVFAAMITLAAALLNVGQSLADVTWPGQNPQPTNVRQLSVAYSVTMNGTTLAVQLNTLSGNTVNGVLKIGDNQCPFAATLNGNTLQGTFDYGGNSIAFTATVQGSVMYLDMMGQHLALQQGA